MRDYGRVATRFWTDPRIFPLDGTAKLVALYLLSGSQTNLIGCMRVTPAHIEADGVCESSEARRALEELVKCGFLEWDRATGLVLLRRWFRYNPISNKDMGTGALRAILQCQPSPLLSSVVESLRAWGDKLPDGWEDQCRHLCLNPSEHTDTEMDTKTKTIVEPKLDPIPYAEIIGHLAKVSGVAFEASSQGHRDLIRARWANGRRLDDFKAVIDGQAKAWRDKPEMLPYLRPSTLFAKKHFDEYLAAAKAAPRKPSEPADPGPEYWAQDALRIQQEEDRKRAERARVRGGDTDG